MPKSDAIELEAVVKAALPNAMFRLEIEMGEVQERLAEQQVALELDKSAKEFLVDKGFDPIFGARPLKRTIQRYVEDPLAEEIISGRAKEKMKVKVSRRKDREELEFHIS